MISFLDKLNLFGCCPAGDSGPLSGEVAADHARQAVAELAPRVLVERMRLRPALAQLSRLAQGSSGSVVVLPALRLRGAATLALARNLIGCTGDCHLTSAGTCWASCSILDVIGCGYGSARMFAQLPSPLGREI